MTFRKFAFLCDFLFRAKPAAGQTSTWPFKRHTFSRPSTSVVVALMVMVALVGGAGTATAGQLLYVSGIDFTTHQEFLGTVDVSTGAFSQIAAYSQSSFIEFDGIYGIGFTGTGQLTAISFSGDLYSINTSNGALTFLENVGVDPSAVTGDGNGNLIVADYNNIWKINVATGAKTVLASGVTTDDGLIAQSPTGKIFFSDFGYPTVGDEIRELDPSTGIITNIGDSGIYGQGLYAGAFVGSTLYGIATELVTIDTTTGLATPVSTINAPNGDTLLFLGAAYQAVPEPSAFVLMAIAILGIGFYRIGLTGVGSLTRMSVRTCNLA